MIIKFNYINSKGNAGRFLSLIRIPFNYYKYTITV